MVSHLLGLRRAGAVAAGHAGLPHRVEQLRDLLLGDGIQTARSGVVFFIERRRSRQVPQRRGRRSRSTLSSSVLLVVLQLLLLLLLTSLCHGRLLLVYTGPQSGHSAGMRRRWAGRLALPEDARVDEFARRRRGTVGKEEGRKMIRAGWVELQVHLGRCTKGGVIARAGGEG